MLTKEKIVRIICLGNPLHGDDGIGFHIFNRLQHQYTWPPHIELIDGGTGGITLIPCFFHCHKVIMIDAVNNPSQAGQLTCYLNIDPHLFSETLVNNRAFEHGGNVTSLLELLTLSGAPTPCIDIVTIAGCNFNAYNHQLSEAVSHRLPTICAKLYKMICK
ncbi:hydrogenase maturation protease [Zooshikella ganghwensis]|uniref:Hydrogenase maturation protease n=1 Tax=Zooshikella ganghwensis TaxID=202772 RepID=A0A4P9VN85_9GAMM|nr:hydrogenase maturation protease [Zooshikella ganghwensis]RDH44109.1 hydrogenase maturation protease [Zooshikella ganghwensis]